MKLSKIVLLLVISGAFIFSSCDDEKDPDPAGTGKTKTELLIGANWKLKSATFNPPIVISVGMATITLNNLEEAGADSCQLDNLLMFNADSTITLDNGPKKCVPADPQIVQDGNWRFMNNETQIEITNSEYFKLVSKPGSNTVILDKVTVSETQLTGQTDYEFNDPIKGPVTTKITFTFIK